MRIFQAKIIVIVAIIVLAIVAVPTVEIHAVGSIPYENYIYSENNGELQFGPQAYTPSKVIYASNMNVGELLDPTDIDTDNEGNIYLLDAGNSRILVLNQDFQLLNTFQGFDNAGVTDNFTEASGLFVDNMYIYIADTEKGRIIILDRNTGTLVRVVGTPKSDILGKDFLYKPIRLVVDSDRLLYIVSEGTYEGIINLDWDGKMIGFVGSNTVTASAWDVFWKQFSTKKQRATMQQFIPQDISSIDIDNKGFYYTTMLTAQNGNMVKRLNPGGSNILRSFSKIPVAGDVISAGNVKASMFVDVSCAEDGIYACLDSANGKIFVYNNDGYLLYTFGAISEQDGGFTVPVALTWLNDGRIAVLDKSRDNITVFSPTPYANSIKNAIHAQISLDYEGAFKLWEEVLKLNNGFTLAQLEVGKLYLNQGKFKEAKAVFKGANNKELYSEALKKQTTDWIYNNSTWLVISAVLLVVLLLSFPKIKAIYRRNRCSNRKEKL